MSEKLEIFIQAQNEWLAAKKAIIKTITNKEMGMNPKELGLDGLDGHDKKGDMVSAVMAQDLTGKMTKELRAEFEPEKCPGCGKDDCACHAE